MLMNVIPVAMAGFEQVGMNIFSVLHDGCKAWIVVTQTLRHSELHFIKRRQGRGVQALQPRCLRAGFHVTLMSF